MSTKLDTAPALTLSTVTPNSNPTQRQVKRFLRYERKIQADPHYVFSMPEKDRIEYIAILRGWLQELPAVLSAFAKAESRFPLAS